MKREIRLYGHLRKRFGVLPRLDVASPKEAIWALCTQVKGFREAMSEGNYRLLVDDRDRSLEEVPDPLGSARVIKIVPVVEGAEDAIGQILVGAALIGLAMLMPGAAIFATGGAMAGLTGAVASVGWALVLGGVAQMLSPQPGVGPQSPNGSNDLPSYAFGSPTVTIGQGRPVPVLYGGPLRIGGAVVSAGVVSEGYQPKGFGGAAPDDAGTMGGNGDREPWVWAIAAQG